MWRAHFGRGFGPVVRQTTKWMRCYYRLFLFISRYKILIQSVRPSHTSPYTTRTISTLTTLLHRLLIDKTIHSIVSEFFFTATCDPYLPYIVLTGRKTHDNAKACVHDSHSPGHFCHMTKCIYVGLCNKTVYKQPNLWDFSVMRLAPPFVLKMTVSVMFVPRAAVAVSAIMNQRTPDAIRGGPTLWQYIVQSRDWPTARFKILNAKF